MHKQAIIVVGAGQAGVQLVDSLRRGGYDGPLMLIGEEQELPYQRPPLSKKFLAGEVDEQRLRFRPASFYEKLAVETLFGRRVVSIDRGNKEVILDDDSRVAYHKLALTTGTRVRRLPVPGAELERVLYLRTIADARQIRAHLSVADKIAVIGGGFIGLEAAAIGRGLGKDVLVLEAQKRLMPRVVAPIVADFFKTLHGRHGVRVITSAQVVGIAEASDGRLAVRCADGNAHAADLVIVGIGVVPNAELAEEAGVACDNGVLVDEFARTSDPDIVAAGDCTMHVNVLFDVRHRLESVQNAVDQARVAAGTLLGHAQPYAQVPWFWSDQYDVQLQMVGIAPDYDQHVLRGEIEESAFSVFYFDGEKLLAVDSINCIADHMICRRLMSSDINVNPKQAADRKLDLKRLLPQ